MTEQLLIHSFPYPAEKVYPYFSQIHQFVAVHPVIFKAEPIGPDEFKLSERLNIAGIKIAFSYPVKLEHQVVNRKVVMYSVVRKGATIKLTFDFTENNGKTELRELVEFNGPSIISAMFMRFLTKTHYQLVERVKTSIEDALSA